MILSLFFSHKNKPEAYQLINAEMSKLSAWLAANKLSLNVEKSKLLVFDNKKNISNSDLLPDQTDESNTIFINGMVLKQVRFAKYLGVLVDDKLKWTNQINAINIKTI